MPYGWDIYELSEMDKDKFPFWVCNVAHSVPAWKPFYTYLWYPAIPWSTQYAAGSICSPRTRGTDWRTYNGYAYIAVHVLRNEDEIKKREVIFRERMGPLIDDPLAFWEKSKAELKSYHDRYIPLNVERMEDWEITHHFRELTEEFYRRVWEIHMFGIYAFDTVFGLFRALCPELTGLAPHDAKISKMLGGFDNSLFQLNKGIAELATQAMKLKLEDNFKLSDEQVLPAMEQSQAGKEWLKAFHDFLSVHGWRMQRMLEVCTPSWIEQPSLVIPEIRRMMATGGTHAPEQERKRLRKEGEEIERELLAKVPATQREWFGKLIRCAQAAQFFSEDHDYWCEFRSFSILRRALMEIAKRFVKWGIMDDPEDIHYLFPGHIIRASHLREKNDLRHVVNRNREEYNGYLAHPPISAEAPLFFGDPSMVGEAAVADPAIGPITAPRIDEPEKVGATCVGAASAPGVVEGVARVIFSPAQWTEIQPGEILVCPMTDATWTPLFGIVKGVVTDSGGTLAHAAIVGREYGIPAVTGCLDATMKIKTGDKIKVDGNLLRVYVLQG